MLLHGDPGVIVTITDVSKISVHSLRAGGATSAANAGIADRLFKRHGRWASENRELKVKTFSGRRRPDWQSKPGKEAAVASLQNSNIKIAVNSGGRRLGRLPKRKIWLHIKN